jgi:hypothetical protein
MGEFGVIAPVPFSREKFCLYDYFYLIFGLFKISPLPTICKKFCIFFEIKGFPNFELFTNCL